MFRKKIFLTGGNGFIGKNIIRILSDKYEIIAPRSNELNLLDSKAVYNFFKKNKLDLILHTASVGVNRKTKDQAGVLEKNLIMFNNLIANKQFFDRMINFGSGAEYNKNYNISMVKEDEFGLSVPTDEYGLAKFTMAKIAEKLDFITHIRLFGVYGRFEDYTTRFISNAICRILVGLPIKIKQNVVFDYLYIDDLVRILDYFIENKPKYNFYNVGRGVSVDLVTLAEKIKMLTGGESSIIIERTGLNNEYTCNIDRLKSEITNLEFTDLNQSISEMLVYYGGMLSSLDQNFL